MTKIRHNNKAKGGDFTWKRAKALQTRFDWAAVKVGGDRNGYIETTSYTEEGNRRNESLTNEKRRF